MEWNWNRKNGMIDVTPFLLFESTGDSEEMKADVLNHQDEEEAAMDASQGHVSFQDDHDDDHDDAQSCSYDHSSYTSISYSNSNHDKAHGSIYDGYDHEDHEDIDDGDDDDDAKNNWGESKHVGSHTRQKRSRNFCVDSSNQREIDRQFWETCLAS